MTKEEIVGMFRGIMGRDPNQCDMAGIERMASATMAKEVIEDTFRGLKNSEDYIRKMQEEEKEKLRAKEEEEKKLLVKRQAEEAKRQEEERIRKETENAILEQKKRFEAEKAKPVTPPIPVKTAAPPVETKKIEKQEEKVYTPSKPKKMFFATKDELEDMNMNDLKKIATTLGIQAYKARRADLIKSILKEIAKNKD